MSRIATFGLFTCKGITIYHPESQRGLLAHLGYTNDMQESLEGLVNSFEREIESTEVHIMQATVTSGKKELNWPSTDRIASFFDRIGANKIMVDNNIQKSITRGMLLNLSDGKVNELRPFYLTARGKDRHGDRGANQPIPGGYRPRLRLRKLF